MSEINNKLLESDLFNIPKQRGSGYLPTYLTFLFSEFLDTFEKFESDSITKNKSKVELLCNRIVESLENYLNGSPVLAYNVLSEGLEQVSEFLMIPKKNVSVSNSNVNLYRARIGSNLLFSKKELFHIPFELRHVVSTQRYSIPGLPCLYLSDSIYTCWEELRRPNINTIQVSRFEVDTNRLHFLDLTQNLLDKTMYKISTKPEHSDISSLSDDFLIKFLMTWPLAAACSIVVEKHNAIFKMEYILPQLVLQWITANKELDGVIFLSSRLNYNAKDGYPQNMARNYVIPSKRVTETGYCSYLSKEIKFTNPVSWEILSIMSPEKMNSKVSKEDFEFWIKNSTRSVMYLDLVPNKDVLYHESIFGRLETECFKLEANSTF